MDHKKTLLQHQVSVPKSILLTVLIMAALIATVIAFDTPNPNMILIAGLVLCSALFGFRGGVPAAVIMLGYSLYFFSSDHSFIHFTPQNLQKVVVSLVGIAADMLLVCGLKLSEIKAFSEIRALTGALNRENDRLQEASLTDALTGVQNRLALQRRVDLYRCRKVAVMMLDVDHFKEINDTFGHAAGDRVLREIGARLKDVFGEKNCYRYGGDEFIVIFPADEEGAFEKKLAAFTGEKLTLTHNGETIRVDYSVGSVIDVMETEDALNALLSKSDRLMYAEKQAKRPTRG